MRRELLLIALTACGGGGSSVNPACLDLSLAECRVTPGCKADICSACFCELAYRGCIGENETPDACPALGCPSALCCSTATECDAPTTCAAPDAPPGCGPCNSDPANCTVDADCKQMSPTAICEPVTCGCNGQKRCTAGCTNDAACIAEGTVCDLASARCVATPCSTDPECPPDFRCNGGHCTRLPCTDDLDCDGFCVLGSCYTGGRGECRPPSA